ncbi:MAG: S8 family peptidase [Elusimicrobia bacterium]|nr:S8 family peptidase [Elusimicrobiota bacterium]
MKIFLLLLAAAVPTHASRVIIGFHGGGSALQAQALQSLGVQEVERIEELDAALAEIPDGEVSVEAIQERALAQPAVAWVEEDSYIHWLSQADSAVVPAAPAAKRSEASGPEIDWGVQKINAPAAWAKNQGEGVRVAVLDTGINFAHPDLAEAVAGGYNAFDAEATFRDDNGHGSHVAGIIAARYNGFGVVGVAPKARLYAVKVLDEKGGAGFFSLAKGLVWCARNGMQVANLSLSSPAFSLIIKAATAYASARGVVIVAAAGNNKGGAVEYPAAHGEAIAVAAMRSDGKIADFSARGPKIEFAAPGVDIRSTFLKQEYQWLSGTSMAAPHVAGLAALAVAQGARDPGQVREMLLRASSALDKDNPAEQNYRLVDAAKIVQ